MSEEEKALAPDPSKGTEHGVILEMDYEQDESLGSDTQTSFHMRAKVHSTEGRKLADIEIPINIKQGQLKEWWGRVIFPDGTTAVLQKDGLDSAFVAKDGVQETRVLRGTLPRVAAGCLIDYGYVTWSKNVYRMSRFSLQRQYPIRRLRFRWNSYPPYIRSVRLTHAADLGVDVKQEANGVFLVAKDLPRVVEEPWMPSNDATRAILTFYYMDKGTDVKDFWNFEGKRLSRKAAGFSSDRAIRQAIASASIPEGAPLGDKLRAAYDWIAVNVRNESASTAEQEEKDAEDQDVEDPNKPAKSASDVLDAGKGRGWQLAYLFLGMARALGAEADVVRATDRTSHYWDPGLLSMEQFDWTLIAVRAPGDADDKAVLVAPGSGLSYGEIPWWIAGANGYLATSKGSREIRLIGSSLETNLSERKASIDFSTEDSTTATWSEAGKGQRGYLTWWNLRRLDPDSRQKVIEEYCGGGGSFDLSRSEGPALETPVLQWQVHCEGEMAGSSAMEGTSEFTAAFEGPWIQPLPELTATARVHPVVFDYPKLSRLSIEVTAPKEFKPGQAPGPMVLERPFARYTLKVTSTPAGFRVERELAFAPLLIMPDEYPSLRDFLAEVRRADKTPLSFVRTGT
jgi:hypothetical protein